MKKEYKAVILPYTQLLAVRTSIAGIICGIFHGAADLKHLVFIYQL